MNAKVVPIDSQMQALSRYHQRVHGQQVVSPS